MTPVTLLALVLLLALETSHAGADDRERRPAPPPGGSVAALEAARSTRGEWTLGPLVVRRGRDGGRTVRADLRYRGAVIGRLRIDPRTGRFLGARERATAPAEALDLARLRGEAERALMDLEVGGWAWPGEHGRAWTFPLVHQGRVVGRLAVSRADGRLITDDEDDD